MWYVQKVMQFINRNAYIMVAVKGTGYCTSAGRAIKLIVNNALRLVAVNVIVDVVVWWVSIDLFLCLCILGLQCGSTCALLMKPVSVLPDCLARVGS